MKANGPCVRLLRRPSSVRDWSWVTYCRGLYPPPVCKSMIASRLRFEVFVTASLQRASGARLELLLRGLQVSPHRNLGSPAKIAGGPELQRSDSARTLDIPDWTRIQLLRGL